MKKLQLFIHNDSDALRIELGGNLLDAWRKESPHQCAVPAVADIGYVADADKHSRTVLVKIALLLVVGVRHGANSRKRSA